jgi:hypothetical protein
MYYFSYAANLNRSHMARLCSGAEPLFPAVLEGYTLTVRRWFNLESKEGAAVRGGVWWIGEEHLPKLDWYEDWPELYRKEAVRVTMLPSPSTPRRTDGATERVKIQCMAYLMMEPFVIPLSPPDPEYLEMVRQGYAEWGLTSVQLDNALKISV